MRQYDTKSIRTIVIGFCVSTLLIFSVILLTSGPQATKPEPTEEQRASKRALLFESKEFTKALGSERNVRLAEQDLYTFAVTTSGEKPLETGAVGFTFTDEAKKINDILEFRGLFYGLSGTIKITVQSFDKEIVRMSITNLETGANIDEYLTLNGPRSRLIVDLPIETDQYSIRYLYESDEVVVTYYDGFSVSSVDETVVLLKKYFQDLYSEDVATFTINTVGDRTLSEIYEYAKNPPAIFIRDDPLPQEE